MLFTSGGGTGLGNGDMVRFQNLRMWAERGLIHIEDSRNNEYKVVSVHTMLERMRGIQDMLRNSLASRRESHSHDQFDYTRITEHQKMLEAMIEVVRKAQSQGTPSDASARRDLVRRRPKTIVVPTCGGCM